MAVLHIATDGPARSVAEDSALGRSLRASFDPDLWTVDPDRFDVIGTIMIDQDATLLPEALETIKSTLESSPDIECFFADALVDDKLELRGAWSPSRVANNPSELDLLVVRNPTPCGGLAERLRALSTAGASKIGHLPAVVLERDSPAAVNDETRRLAAELIAERMTLPRPDKVSVVIPTAGFLGDRGEPLVAAAIAASRTSGIDEVEVVLVIGDEFVGDVDRMVQDDLRVVRRPPGPWNFAAAVNLGVLAAKHHHVLLLNDDVESIQPGWLTEMGGHLRDPTVGAVGGLLLFPDGTVQHAGMIIDDAVPLHCFAGMSLETLQEHQGLTPRDVISVTGACLLTRRHDFLAVGGLNENLPYGFNDVDLCYKLQRRGLRVVFEPSSRLTHHESASREPVTHGWEWDRFVQRWGEVVDPWYHPGFVRSDDPNDRRRNADHIVPETPPAPQAIRTTGLCSKVHYARMQSPESEQAEG